MTRALNFCDKLSSCSIAFFGAEDSDCLLVRANAQHDMPAAAIAEAMDNFKQGLMSLAAWAMFGTI